MGLQALVASFLQKHRSKVTFSVEWRMSLCSCASVSMAMLFDAWYITTVRILQLYLIAENKQGVLPCRKHRSLKIDQIVGCLHPTRPLFWERVMDLLMKRGR